MPRRAERLGFNRDKLVSLASKEMLFSDDLRTCRRGSFEMVWSAVMCSRMVGKDGRGTPPLAVKVRGEIGSFSSFSFGGDGVGGDMLGEEVAEEELVDMIAPNIPTSSIVSAFSRLSLLIGRIENASTVAVIRFVNATATATATCDCDCDCDWPLRTEFQTAHLQQEGAQLRRSGCEGRRE